MAICHVWKHGMVPQYWLTARTVMIDKAGAPEHAKSYRPVSVSIGMHSIVAKLVLNAIRQPIDVSLSNLQARSR